MWGKILLAAVAMLVVACRGGDDALATQVGHAGSRSAIPLNELVVQPGEYFPRALYEQPAGCPIPEGVLGPEQKVLSDFGQEWFSKHLAAAGEVPLIELARNGDPKALHVRFIWLPTFDNPVIARLSAPPGGKVQLDAVRLSGAGGYEPGEVADRLQWTLQRDEWADVARILEKRNVLGQPPANCEMGFDGSMWIIEAIDAHGYHFVERWSPSEGPVREFGERILDLTGWRLGDIY